MPVRSAPRALPATVRPGPARAAHYGTAFAPWSRPPPPLATNARTLARCAGPCAVCGWALLAGEHVADLPAGRGVAHVSGCVAASVS
jgi:hypothetical protein